MNPTDNTGTKSTEFYNFDENQSDQEFYEFDDGKSQIKINQQYDKEVKNGLSVLKLGAVVTAIALMILAVGIPLACTSFTITGAILLSIGTATLIFGVFSAIVGANLYFQKAPEENPQTLM